MLSLYMSLKHLSYARFRFYGLWPGAARSQRSRSNVHAKKLKKRCNMVLRLRQLAAHMQAMPFGSSLTWKARCPLQASSAAGHHPLGQGRRRRFCRRCLFITDASARTSSLFWLLSSATMPSSFDVQSFVHLSTSRATASARPAT